MLDFGFYNMDCLEGMKQFPDKYFDLAVVDPPYGAGFTEGGGCKGWFSKYHQDPVQSDKLTGGGYNRFGNPGSRFERYKRFEDGRDLGGKVRKKIIAWDTAPGKEYFDELFRVSRNQIIWGGNYFNLPPTRCFLVWRKLTISENFSMAMCEYAWTSFNGNAKLFEYAPQGHGENRWHPTAKPVALYEWVLGRFAKDGDTILDTHVGSASSLVACHRTGHKYVGFEIDADYYAKAKERLDRETAQTTMFDFTQKEEWEEITFDGT